MRDQTEWVELEGAGANELVDANGAKIVKAAERNIERKVQDAEQLYGGWQLSQRIVDLLLSDKGVV